MLYRETGDFKVSYRDDQQTFPIIQDRWLFWGMLAVAFLVIPFIIDDYWEKSIVLPFLVFSLAAIGLNILTGYCGLLSLGTGGFMAVGAYASYKLMTAFPELNIVIVILLSGGVTAAVGMFFGLPSLRIKGFYLAVATLAAQFFLVWLFNKVPWFYNYSATGQITAPERSIFGFAVTGPEATPAATYLFCLAFVTVLALVAKNLIRGRIGRSWMSIRDMDIAAEIIGVPPMRTKLSAFAVSSFYIGIAGALYFTVWFGAAEPTEAFGINQSFLVLFMVIIGGLGSMLGSFLGAAFMVLLPIVLKNIMVGGFDVLPVLAKHVEITLVGSLIIFFLIVEPHGLARLWSIAKEKMRLWPFPH
ncbi:branched-chain amino acid ABC transporter permease [Oceanibacterium hippocampi]|uniref:Leucine/isoleucine/valine transporter permease subunit n=1 Tax=Oceanibacterium hippocampi TaxID=745714 RepID=A0A1Y5RD64_9PROT|nr:branched-chain amino acid ABC transporter permease [Oceanibacterium hippocampi]SLN14743.1 leucine/isoleucine/valine transporter permease subunit [Oceanibacterium hippocampi]